MVAEQMQGRACLPIAVSCLPRPDASGGSKPRIQPGRFSTLEKLYWAGI